MACRTTILHECFSTLAGGRTSATNVDIAHYTAITPRSALFLDGKCSENFLQRGTLSLLSCQFIFGLLYPNATELFRSRIGGRRKKPNAVMRISR